MPGALGAISARRKRRERIENGEHTRSPAEHSRIGTQHALDLTEADKKVRALKAVMLKYDTNNSGKLEEDQVKALLTDTDTSTPPGEPPTDDELDFVLKIADQAGDGSLTISELEFALKTWNLYISHKAKMETALDKYDKSGTGKLNFDELKRYLTDLNRHPVSDVEVQWVLKEADVFGDGEIRKVEMVMATSAWYAHAEQKRRESIKSSKSSACTVM